MLRFNPVIAVAVAWTAAGANVLPEAELTDGPGQPGLTTVMTSGYHR